MRIVFLGTPSFAVPALRRLTENVCTSYEVVAVFTQPDRPSGRGQKLHPSPVKVAAGERSLPVFQPERIRAEENRSLFESLRPDFIVVVAYGQILPGWLLQSAKIASVNIHASLLPAYRGAAPISWALINGEIETGVTTMLMAEKLDAGPILLQEKAPIPLEMSAGELAERLAEVGAELLVPTLEGLCAKAIVPRPQEDACVSWAPRITKDMALISWDKPAAQIHNQVRGMNPWPGAHAIFRGQRLHLWRTVPLTESITQPALPGTLLAATRNAIRVQCGEGTALDILEIQKPGKPAVSGREFANGARLVAGETFQ